MLLLMLLLLLLLLLGSLIMHNTLTHLFCFIFTVSPNTHLFLCREPVKGIHMHSITIVTSCLHLNLIQLHKRCKNPVMKLQVAFFLVVLVLAAMFAAQGTVEQLHSCCSGCSKLVCRLSVCQVI